MLTLSQVIYGVQDLDFATRQIESRGFTVVDGGHHPGLGTAQIPLRIVDGTPGVHRVGLSTSRGILVLP